MKNKTSVSILSVVVIAITILLSLSVTSFAAGNMSAEVHSAGCVSVGDEITFSVSLRAEGVQGIAVIPTYDDNVFELVSGEWVFTDGLMPDFSVSTGDGVIAFASPKNVEQNILFFTLRAKEEVVIGSKSSVSAQITVNSGSNTTITATETLVTIECKHNYTTEDLSYLKTPASCTSAAVYYKLCTICGDHSSATFTYGDKLSHNYIDNTDAKHIKTPASCTSATIYYKSCSMCQANGTETFTSGSALGHSYQTAWSSDSSSHWHECSVCQNKKDVSAHTPGPEATATSAQICTVCNYVIASAGCNHDFSSQYEKNDLEHWYTCSKCGEKKDVAYHVYTDDCDANCNECAYTRTAPHAYLSEFIRDGETHWRKCGLCGKIKDKNVHTFENAFTTVKNPTDTECGLKINKCKDCGEPNYVIIPSLVHSIGHDEDSKAQKGDDTILVALVVIESVLVVILFTAWLTQKNHLNKLIASINDGNADDEASADKSDDLSESGEEDSDRE